MINITEHNMSRGTIQPKTTTTTTTKKTEHNEISNQQDHCYLHWSILSLLGNCINFTELHLNQLCLFAQYSQKSNIS